MRSRRYTWHGHVIERTWIVDVYADRSVNLAMGHPDGEVMARADHLQTREEAAFFLGMARHEYDVIKTYL